jgi:phosphinothricin acetyltransferase
MSAVDVLSETELEVRDALPDDVHAITAIYAWHVLHGRASLKKSPDYRRNAPAYEKRG